MLGWMRGHPRREKIRNEDIRGKVRVASVVDKMREARLRWFEHVKGRTADVPLRRCEKLPVISLTKGRSRTRKNKEVIR